MSKSAEVTKEEFERFISVRNSGVTNMFDRNTVCDLADITAEQWTAIMSDKGEFAKKWPDVMKAN